MNLISLRISFSFIGKAPTNIVESYFPHTFLRFSRVQLFFLISVGVTQEVDGL